MVSEYHLLNMAKDHLLHFYNLDALHMNLVISHQRPSWILMFSLAKIQKWCHKQASHATFTRKSGITQVFMSIYLSYIFNMAAAGHFGFWLFPNSAAIFARVMGAHSFLNTPKSSNQMSNLTMLSVVTGPPDITQLIHNGSCVQCWIPPKEALQFHELLFRRI